MPEGKLPTDVSQTASAVREGGAMRDRFMRRKYTAIVFVAYYVVPTLFLIAAESIAPYLNAEILLRDVPLLEALPALWADWLPEFVVSTVITSGVWIALPSRLRVPRWGGGPDPLRHRTGPSAAGSRRWYLGIRLGVWIALLSMTQPFRGSVNSSVFDDRTTRQRPCQFRSFPILQQSTQGCVK